MSFTLPLPPRLLFPMAMLILQPLYQPAQAQTRKGAVDRSASALSYTGNHPLHSWTGTSRSVGGSVSFNAGDPSQGSVEIRVPVESFDSGNGNRDSNMLDAVEVERYPNVVFVSDRIEATGPVEEARPYAGSWVLHGNLTFHGVTRPLSIPASVRIEKNLFTADATFSIALDDFKVRRPKLMLRRIDNEIQLEGHVEATLTSTGSTP